jgi:hypothetical protein
MPMKRRDFAKLAAVPLTASTARFTKAASGSMKLGH